MGKPSEAAANSHTDAVSLHSNPGAESAAFQLFHDDDASELNADDLPPVYSDAIEDTSSSAPLLAGVPAPRPSQYGYFAKDANTGAEFYVDRGLESPADLERHIRYLATIPPRPYIKIVGTHSQSHKNKDGKTEKKTITDFDVSVEMTPYLYSDAQYRRSWAQLRTVDNSQKTRRGTIMATRAPGSKQRIEVGGDPKPTLEEWCHLYCASRAGLKSFALRRQMTGFDFTGIKDHLVGLVRRTNYRGSLSISLETRDELVEVYNEARINRWRLTAWIWWLCALTLTFVFTWPYLFLRTKRWEVAMAEWPFSRMAENAGREYVSISEEQWYNLWARAILSAVLEKRQTVLDQADLRRAQEPEPSFESANVAVDGAVGFFRAGMSAMNEVNRHLGWGGDC